jgi:hypothetical protein
LFIKQIFDRNQRFFTGSNPKAMIKATFVIEEAQSVIGQNSDYVSFVELAKEGRKYSLGGIFITQQPGSIPFEILSQADNFFTFHLLSRSDLENLRKANAHFSDDVLTQILSEPIPGKCYMWTSFQPFVLPVKIDDFEKMITAHNSVNVQQSSNLLNDIKIRLQEATSDPMYKRILEKFQQVEKRFSDAETSKRTIEMFKILTDEELLYLREKGQLESRKSDGVEFAVKTRYYNSLRK